MSSLLMHAAQTAAQADGLTPPNEKDGLSSMQARVLGAPATAPRPPAGPHPTLAANANVQAGAKRKGPPLRRGKWTPEEEAYANRLIQEFKAGLLPLTDGTTLRTFLSKLLNCDPMRISKKFVGSNCIGKQVFRRRTADLNRLTPEQIQQSRAELSELERRFLERVAQTNRVKSSGVGGAASSAAAAGEAALPGKPKEAEAAEPPSPPWLQPPLGYRHGAGAAFAAANLSGANSRAAAAGRALLTGMDSAALKAAMERKASADGLASHGSAGMLAMAELQRRASQQSLLQNALNQGSASNLLAAAQRGSSAGLSSSAMAQLAQNASAARLAGLAGGNSSMNNLMLKTGLSRDQLSQLARDRGLSSNSLSNMMQKQNSFDALMSLDFQSLQSIDNLANLIQTGSGGNSHVPESGMKNADFGGLSSASRQNLAAATATGSSGDLSAAARRLATSGRIDSLVQPVHGGGDSGDVGASSSNANFHNLMQSMQGSVNSFGGIGNASTASLFAQGNSPSAVSLANLLRQDSSTGLTALRMQDGLNQRNTSVDDFLSLMAAGDIPHQDPSLLNVPLMYQQGSHDAAARLLAQQQMLHASGNSAMANALASRSFQNLGSTSNLVASTSAAALAMAQARAAGSGSKRKLDDVGDDHEEPSSKR